MAAKEGTMVFHMLCENHSFRSMSCLTKIMQNVFNHKKYECAQSKSSAIVCNVFEPMVVESMKAELDKATYISIATDASNHQNLKLFPVLFRYYIPLVGIRTRLVDLVSLPGEKAQQIKDLLLDVLTKFDVKDKLICFCADNAPTNFGQAVTRAGTGNVFRLLQNEFNNSLIGIGCLAHILHNAINSGCTTVLPHDMEAVIVKIYKHFYIYTQRTEKLKEICETEEIIFEQLKSYGATRFVAMKTCLQTILKLFDALVEYFENNPKELPVTLKRFFDDPLCRFLLQFLRDACDNFETTILNVEGDKVCGVEAICKALQLKNLLDSQLETQFLTISTTEELNKAIEKETANGKILEKKTILETIVCPFYGKVFELSSLDFPI